jgi:hypothetical protein
MRRSKDVFFSSLGNATRRATPLRSVCIKQCTLKEKEKKQTKKWFIVSKEKIFLREKSFLA